MWAWSLDMEEDPEFAEGFGMQLSCLSYVTHNVLGPSLHPLFSSLSHLINDFNSSLSTTTAVVLSRLHVIPSARYTQGRYPAALARHLSFTIPPPSATFGTMNFLSGSVETIRGKGPEDFQLATSSSKAAEVGKNTFLGTMTMDMRKWNWPDYLTFGKGNLTRPSSERSTFSESEKNKEEELVPPVHLQVPSQVEVEVNANDLQDAIVSDSISLTLQGRHPSPHEETKDLSPDHVDGLHDEPNGSSIRDFTDVNSTHDQESFSMKSTLAHQREETLPLTPSPLPEFTLTRLHLAPWDKPTETQQVSIHYLIVRFIHI